MADEKISAMPAAAALTGAEIVPLLQGGANVKSTAQDIANLAPASGDVIGPAGAVADNFASFNGATGKIIKDSGKSAASFDVAGAAATAQTNAEAYTDAQIPLLALEKSNNLSDLTNVATARANLGVASAGIEYHPGFAANQYYTAPGVGAFGTIALAANRLYAIPFYCPFTKTFTKLSASVTAGVASSNIELGIYNCANGIPTTLAVDGGSISSATASLKEISALTINLTPGWYFLAIASDSNPTLQGYTNTSWLTGQLLGYASPGSFITGLFGAWAFSAGNLPLNFPAVSYSSLAAQPLVYIRL